MRQASRAAVAGYLSLALGSLTTIGAFAADGEGRDAARPARLGYAVPTPRPVASARPRRRGRTTFALSGAATVTDRVAPGSGTAPTVSNVLGLEGRVEHRGDAWGFVGTLPAMLALHGSQVGNPEAALVARRFALFYRTQPLAPFGQLPVGSLPRAYGIALRSRDTELTAFAGSTTADGDTTYRLEGVEAKRALGRAAATLGVVAGQAQGAAGRFVSAVAGFATAPGKIDATLETALSWARGIASTPDANGALSYQARVNAGGSGSYASYIERSVASSLVQAGGQAQPDRYHGLAYHVTGRTAVDVSVVQEAHPATATAVASDDTRASLGLRRRIGAGDAALSVTAERTAFPDAREWNGGLNASYGVALGHGSYAALTAALQRQGSNSAGPSSSAQLDGRLATALGRTARLELEASDSSQTQEGDLERTRSLRASVTRAFGRVEIGAATAFSRIAGGRIDARQTETFLTLGTKITPTISARVEYGVQATHDALGAPAKPSRFVNVSFGAPFSLGNGQRRGAPDARLPAKISGSVVNSGIASDAMRADGLAGVTVVLDGGETQRTDYLGHFEFPFVSPGQHTISIEPAALPRGVTPDLPFVTVSVSGGETATAVLAVSAAASIAGHVFATGSDGQQIPVSGVAVELDGNRRVTTGPNGEYGFGRLPAGSHVVTLVESTFPAGFEVEGGLRRSVTAALGSALQVDFTSAPLGTIAGLVLAPGENGGTPQPVANAYVVAQPGDHAAITDDTGAFIIDGLPAGAYALELDESTLPENLSGGEKRPVTLTRGERVDGLRIALEPRAHDIDFSFNGSQETVLQLTVRDAAVPPGGAARISVLASAPVTSVAAEVLGHTVALVAGDDRRHWAGDVLVPFGTPDGAVDLVVRSGGLTQHAALAVNGTLPLVTLQTTPASPTVGSYVVVRARFAVPARKGDRIQWKDGQVTTLGAPLADRIFAFSVKTSELPFSGVLFSAGEKVPIVIRGRARASVTP